MTKQFEDNVKDIYASIDKFLTPETVNVPLLDIKKNVLIYLIKETDSKTPVKCSTIDSYLRDQDIIDNYISKNRICSILGNARKIIPKIIKGHSGRNSGYCFDSKEMADSNISEILKYITDFNSI